MKKRIGVMKKRIGVMKKRILHGIAHWLGWNCGHVETWWAKNGKLMVGFRCECGKLSGIAPTGIERKT